VEKIIKVFDHDKLFTEILALLTVSENKELYHNVTSSSGWAHCAKPLLSNNNQVGWLIEGVMDYEFIHNYKESWLEISQDNFNQLNLNEGPDTQEADEYTLGVFWQALQSIKKITLDNSVLKRHVFGKYKYSFETENGSKLYKFNTQEEFVNILNKHDLWLELAYQSWKCERKASLLTKLANMVKK
jgi:hypothetical protein